MPENTPKSSDGVGLKYVAIQRWPFLSPIPAKDTHEHNAQEAVVTLQKRIVHPYPVDWQDKSQFDFETVNVAGRYYSPSNERLFGWGEIIQLNVQENGLNQPRPNMSMQRV